MKDLFVCVVAEDGHAWPGQVVGQDGLRLLVADDVGQLRVVSPIYDAVFRCCSWECAQDMADSTNEAQV